MRSIILILVLIFPSLISEARADACQAAIARYNKASRAEAETYVAAFQKIMGMTPAAYVAAHRDDHTTSSLIDLCTKTEGIMRARIPPQEAITALYHVAESACPQLMRHKNDVKGGTGTVPSEVVIANVTTVLANCAAATANAGTAPPASSNDQAASSNPSGSRAEGSDQVAKAGPGNANAGTPPASSNAPGTNKALPVPPTIPAPTAGQSRQQIIVARRSEETSIFQSSSSSSGSSSSTYSTSSSGGWGGMSDCIDMNQYGCTQWINMPSNIPSTTQQTGGNVSGASRPIRYTVPRRSTTSSTPAQQSADLTAFLNSLPPDDPRIPLLLDALDKLNKQHPKEVPPVPPQELQCLLAPPESGSDEPLKPLQICWSPDQIRKEGMQDAGLCQGITDDAELEDCIQQNFGSAVLAVLPELSRYCYAGPDYSTDTECAKRKFDKAWDDFHKSFNIQEGLAFDDSRRHPTSRGPCAIVPPPDPMTWTTPGMAACKAKRQSLRKNLRCQLDPKCSGQPNDDGNDNTPVASQNPPPDAPTAPPESPPLPKELDAWCNFMADAHRRGDYGNIPIPAECPREQTAYGKPPDGPQFSMNPSETDQAINDLIKQWQDYWKDDAPDQSTQTNSNVPK